MVMTKDPQSNPRLTPIRKLYALNNDIVYNLFVFSSISLLERYLIIHANSFSLSTLHPSLTHSLTHSPITSPI